MKGDVNDTLREQGPDAVRARHDKARKLNSGHHARFALTAFEDIKVSTTPNYVVKGMIPRGGLIIIWGAPKCGKSFWTFDMVMHVALGREYRGRRVQQGGVVYLALEGGSGFAARVEAWRRRHLGDGEFQVGDVVQVETNGAFVFKEPVKIRKIFEHEGNPWVYFEGVGSGAPMTDLRTVQARVPFYLLDVPSTSSPTTPP